jgi:hypothetical protein
MTNEEAIKNMNNFLLSLHTRGRVNIVIPEAIEALQMAVDALQKVGTMKDIFKSKSFLTLDDAVMVVVERMELAKDDDREWVRDELEQRCFCCSSEYEMGYIEAVHDVNEKLKNAIASLFDNEAP